MDKEDFRKLLSQVYDLNYIVASLLANVPAIQNNETVKTSGFLDKTRKIEIELRRLDQDIERQSND